jgi:sugar O-acyltransferase (sialic acid O-acetyltransferase NeuD family)
MTPLLLIGGGGHCHSVIDVIEASGTHTVAGIVLRAANGCTAVMGYPVLGCDDDLPRLLACTPDVLIAVGQIKSSDIRQQLFKKLCQLGARLPVVASGCARLSRHAQVDAGSILMHGVLVNAGARIGRNAILNSLALIEHDAVVGDHCHIATGARINGGAYIGDSCFIGSGAIIGQGVVVGANSIIGAGCVLTRDVPDYSFLKGHA